MDCIEIDYCPEFQELPFDVEAERAAALATLPGESCGAGAACVMGEQPAGFVPEIDMKLFDPVIAGLRAGTGLVEALHTTQDAYGYLPRVALENIAEETHLPFSRVFGVASFYAQFRLTPVGKHVISVCMGTACHVAGAPLVAEAFAQELDIAGRRHHAGPAVHARDGQLHRRLRPRARRSASATRSRTRA